VSITAPAVGWVAPCLRIRPIRADIARKTARAPATAKHQLER
jgi:hypothetical protein